MDFGFFFDRVLHFYGGLSYRELLSLPIRTFWRMHSNINRIRAEDNLRTLQVAVASQSEGVAKYRDHLVVELGKTTEVDPIASAYRDHEGIAKVAALKDIANVHKRKE